VTRIHVRFIGALAIAGLGLAGCATAMGEGSQALREGYYADAATHFEEALAEDPDRSDALLGLGVAKYRAGDADGAIEALERLVAREPRASTGRLYLALAYLGTGDLGRVEEHLTAYMRESPGTRLAAQADRALRLLRGPDGASEDLRAFVAASLENHAEMEREVVEAQRYARDAEFRARWFSYDPFWPRPYYIYRGRRR
jgi:tetratricopeptide (TPR) repeat protein